ncbi:MAG: xanthine dehydrogenase family protein subunit M [Thermoanaerobaculia bacterium]
MKPAPFLYHAPATLDEALALLAEHGDEAKVLAGGQSLVPTMNFRLAQPSVLIDLNRIGGLDAIHEDENGGLSIGAMTRQRAVERSALVAERAPLVHETMPFIAHPQIRNRGTFGGSIAHADPAAELPAVMLALEADFVLRSARGERRLPASRFYTGLFETALEPEEILVDVEIPGLPPGTGWAFREVSRRHGDYALVGAAALLTLDGGVCTDARITFLSVGEGPTEAVAAGRGLRGQPLTEDAVEAAAVTASTTDIDPPADIHASEAYRRHLAKVLTRQVLNAAAERART